MGSDAECAGFSHGRPDTRKISSGELTKVAWCQLARSGEDNAGNTALSAPPDRAFPIFLTDTGEWLRDAGSMRGHADVSA